MSDSSQISSLLDLAVAKASQLSPSQQDRFAREIFLMISGEEAPSTPDHGSLSVVLDFAKSILPVRDSERTIALILEALILFVLAPFIILLGISAIVRESRIQSSPTPVMESQARHQQVEKQAEGGEKDTDHGDDIRQALEQRAERSERENERWEAYYSLWEGGLFEERTVLRLAKDPARYPQVVSKINRAISLSPGNVSTVLRTFQLTLEKFRTEEYTCRDIQDYYDVKDCAVKALRKTFESQ